MANIDQELAAIREDLDSGEITPQDTRWILDMAQILSEQNQRLIKEREEIVSRLDWLTREVAKLRRVQASSPHEHADQAEVW